MNENKLMVMIVYEQIYVIGNFIFDPKALGADLEALYSTRSV